MILWIHKKKMMNQIDDKFRAEEVSKLAEIISVDKSKATEISWEINKQLLLASTVFLTLVGGFLSQSNDLTLVNKLTALTSIILHVFSIIFGIVQFFSDQLFFDKQIVKKEVLKKILNETFFNGLDTNKYGRFLEQYNLLAKTKSSSLATSIQAILFILGILFALIFVIIRVF